MNDHDQHLYKLHTSNNNANTVVTCLKIIKLWSQNNNCKSNDKNIKQREKKTVIQSEIYFFQPSHMGFFFYKKSALFEFLYCSILFNIKFDL